MGANRVAEVRAEIDISNSERLEAQLVPAVSEPETRLVLSLSGCPYMDSSGLRVLIRLANSLGDRFAAVAAPGCHARRIIEISGLLGHMRVFDSLDEALAGADVPAEAG